MALNRPTDDDFLMTSCLWRPPCSHSYLQHLTVTLPTGSTEPKEKNFTCYVFTISTHFSSLEVWLLNYSHFAIFIAVIIKFLQSDLLAMSSFPSKEYFRASSSTSDTVWPTPSRTVPYRMGHTIEAWSMARVKTVWCNLSVENWLNPLRVYFWDQIQVLFHTFSLDSIIYMKQ